MKKVFAVVVILGLVALIFAAPVQAAAQFDAHAQITAQDEVPPADDGVGDFTELVDLFKESFPGGAWIALAVLVFVYAARINGLVVNGNWARIANVTLSTILSGLDPLNPNAEQALVAIIAALSSGLLFELIQMGSKKLSDQKKLAEQKAKP